MKSAPGAFEVLGIHARGAYGTLVRARRSGDDLQRVVALKVLKGSLSGNPRVLTRTRDEARLLSLLQHPNIVHVEELLSINRRPIMVMEWVDGSSLRRLLDQHRTGLPADIVLEVTRRTARALDEAYNGRASQDGTPLKIVHRDIKPENLMLSVHGEVKVVDFGVARADFVDRETTTVSTILGSQGYMAPERLSGAPDGPPVDIYSLGVTTVELLTGRLPLLVREASSHRDTLERHLVRMELAPELEPHRDRIVALMRDMCSFEPEDRPSADDVIEAIRSIQVDTGVSTSLEAWAADVVVPFVRNQPHLPPREHPAWDDIRFLEEAGPDPDLTTAVPARTATAPHELQHTADRRVRRFLAAPGWEDRKRELKWLLALHPEWTAAPFLEVVRAVNRPWWRVWARRTTPPQVALALDVLKHRAGPEVLAAARGLLAHSDPTVAEAARRLVAQRG